jgi:hypothetical protein
VSGEILNFCTPLAGSTDPTLAGCQCLYTFQNPTNFLTESRAYAPLYFEADLVRCGIPNDNIPEGVHTFTLQLIQTGNYTRSSNTFSINTVNQFGPNQPEFYSDIHRYMCRWIPFIPHMLDGGIIDPIQSNSDNTAANINYFTSNIGNAFYQFAVSSQPFFHCPPHIDPNKTSLELRDANGALISTSAGVSAGSEDRVNFSLARYSSAPFNLPVLMPQAPGFSGVIGYGVSPDSTGACPTSTSISVPSNMRWRKLWLYRAQLPQRTYYSRPTANYDLICNPGKFKNTSFDLGTGGISARYPSPYNKTYYPSDYFIFHECGSTLGSYPVATGTSCWDPAGLSARLQTSTDLSTSSKGLSRILLQRGSGGHTLDPSTPEAQNDYNRCVTVEASGTWEDACPLSGNSCQTLTGGKSFDIFGLCGNSNALINTYSDGVENPLSGQSSIIDYLLLVSDPSVTFSDLTSHKYSQYLPTRPAGSGSSTSVSYIPIQNQTAALNQINFPVCVLQKVNP